MIESEANHVPIRVLNINEEPIHLEKGKILGQLEPVQLIEEATTKEQEPYEECIDELVSKVDTSVKESHKIELRKLLQGYQSILSTSEYDLGEAVDVRHNINTGDATPLRDALRRHPINHQEVLDEQVKKMLKNNVIGPLRSSWSSNVVLVKKKENKLRFCVDCRKLN